LGPRFAGFQAAQNVLDLQQAPDLSVS
jgi:hypothetical protein